MAINKSLRNFSLLSYSGKSNVLKHVALVGKDAVSGPFRCNLNFVSKFFNPPIGAREH